MKVILSEIERRDSVTVNELSNLLGVSAVTIRSDLEELSRMGRIHRTRGGATRPLLERFDGNFELPLEETRRQLPREKRRIGQAAAALIQDGETVFLDVGSTATEVARHISPALQGVTVVTNSLNIALELEALPNLTIIVTGGTLRRLQHSLVNPLGLELLRDVHADRLFLGCNGVSVQAGVTNRNLPEAEIKRQMVTNSREVYVLADHSKLGVTSSAAIAPLDRVTRLITDRAANPQEIGCLEAAGLDVLCV
nr:DeoR/GlpR family DNA-binding transcription regulator [Deinobacterium chartae]